MMRFPHGVLSSADSPMAKSHSEIFGEEVVSRTETHVFEPGQQKQLRNVPQLIFRGYRFEIEEGDASAFVVRSFQVGMSEQLTRGGLAGEGVPLRALVEAPIPLAIETVVPGIYLTIVLQNVSSKTQKLRLKLSGDTI